MNDANGSTGSRPFNRSVAIWLLCHYPDTTETDERVAKAAQLSTRWGLPIWLYGSSSARYPESVERLIKEKLVRFGVDPAMVCCSGDASDSPISLDTVEEALNVAADAKRRGTQTLICV